MKTSTTPVPDFIVLIWEVDWSSKFLVWYSISLLPTYKMSLLQALCKASISSKKNNSPTKIKIKDNQPKDLVMKEQQKA